MQKTSLTIKRSSGVDLPDVNVWLAMVDETHVHHSAARLYWEEAAAPQIAFSRVTMPGFLRLSAHSRVLTTPLSPREAWSIYEQFRALPEIGFISESSHVESCFCEFSAGDRFPLHLWTDAFLAAFARTRGCRMVSFDSDFKRFRGLDFLHLKKITTVPQNRHGAPRALN
jgi:toxin-antitoxin system PIN domain toxin